MKLGACHLWGDSLDAYRSDLRLAAELGFGVAAIGDSPAGWHELYISLAIAAQESPDAIVAPFVTSPFVRHPIINANAMCSLADAYGDRFALGLATGGSNVMAIGHAPANQAQIRDYFQALRSLFAGEPGQYDGAPVSALRHARRIPIFYSAFGAKALALAGEQADGVILFTNHDLDAFDRKLAAVHAAAVRAGRNPEDIEVWATAYCSVRETRAAALADLTAFSVVNGMAIARMPEVLAQIPKQYHAALAELARRYDPTEHCVVGGANSRLPAELGLTDLLGGFDTVAGPPAEVKKVLDGLTQRGVAAFISNLPGNADKHGTLRRLHAVFNKH
jgi:alkanesulfonate monooxygenase SsuD/methylene tetrahydromethanopterin reductase-like flavin-dependent oxidoreductase (luciferase family)